MVKNESTESLHDFPIIPLVSFKTTCDRFMVLDKFLFYSYKKTNSNPHRVFKTVRFSISKSIKVLQR